MKSVKTLIVVATLLVSFSANAQTADEIIAKHVAAMGGEQKLSSLQTVKMEGSMSTQGVDVNLVLTKKHFEGQRLDLEIMGTSNYQVVNTKKGSVFMPIMQQNDPRDMTAEEFKAGLKQLDVQGNLFDYKKKGNKVDFAGEDKINGKKVYKLKVGKDGDITTYYVDADTYYVVQTNGTANVQGSNIEVVSNFSDFKKNEDGFVFPYTIASMQGTINWSKISTNVPVDSKFFDN